MNVGFPEMDEKFIKSKVENGFYMNETEVVRDAVRHMRQEEERRKNFRAAVQLGVDQIAKGEGIPYTEELMDDMERNATIKANKGQPINNSDAVNTK